MTVLVCKNAITSNLKAYNFQNFSPYCSSMLCNTYIISIKNFLLQTLAGYVADSTDYKSDPLTMKHLPMPMPISKDQLE